MKVKERKMKMEDLENKKYWIWLSLIKGLGCVRKNKLLKMYGTPERIG